MEKIKLCAKQNTDKIVAVLIGLVVFVLWLMYTDVAMPDGAKTGDITLFALILLFALCICLVLKVREIVIMAIVFLLLIIGFSKVNPLGNAADERSHFFRCYEIANVSLISRYLSDGNTGDILPTAVMYFEDENATIDWNDTQEVAFSLMTVYAPVSYIPQAIGIKLTGLFTNNVQKIFWGGRWANALICYLICMAALCVAPFGKRLLFLFMVFPMTLQEFMSVAADGFALSCALFFFAYVCRLAYKSEEFKIKDAIILAVAGLFISLSKIVYVVLIFLVLIIPDNKFKKKTHAVSFKTGIIVINWVINLAWLKIGSGFLKGFSMENIDSGQQIKHILSDIIGYISVCVRAVAVFAVEWTSQMIGSVLGQADIPLSGFVWIALFVLLIVTCLKMRVDSKIKLFDRVLMLFIFFATSGLILTSEYLTWTPIGAPIIVGTQGRYFTPILAFLCVFIASAGQQNNKKNIKEDDKNKAEILKVADEEESKTSPLYFYVIVLCNLMAIVDIAVHYV